MISVLNELMTGAIAMAFLTAGLFFLKFWRQSRDRLFAFFAVSYVTLAANRIALIIAVTNDVKGDYFYWIRLTAFAIILLAIMDKNRSRQLRGFDELHL